MGINDAKINIFTIRSKKFYMELTKYNRTDINDYQDMTTDDMTMNVTTDSDMKVIRHNSIMTRAGGTATTQLRRMPTGDVFDLQGRRVATEQQVQDGTWQRKATQGVYIRNGRKFVVK